MWFLYLDRINSSCHALMLMFLLLLLCVHGGRILEEQERELASVEEGKASAYGADNLAGLKVSFVPSGVPYPPLIFIQV